MLVFDQTGNGIEKGGLAATRQPHDRHKFPFPNVKTHPIDCYQGMATLLVKVTHNNILDRQLYRTVIVRQITLCDTTHYFYTRIYNVI